MGSSVVALLVAALPLALPARSQTIVPLAVSGEHEGASACVLGGDGQTLFVAHRSSASVTAVDIASGQVTDEVVLGGELFALAADETRARLVAVDVAGSRVHVLDAQSLDVLHTIPTSVPAPFEIHVAGGADRAVLVADTAVSVLDLGAGAESLSFSIPPLPILVAHPPRRLVLAPDGASAVVLTPQAFSATLERFDLATGAVMGTATFLGGGRAEALVPADRASFVVFGATPTGPIGERVTLTRYDTLTLAEQSTTVHFNALDVDRAVAISDAADRVLVQEPTRAEHVLALFPGPGSGPPPSVVSFDGRSGTAPLVSGDFERIVSGGRNDGLLSVRDGITGAERFVPLGRGGVFPRAGGGSIGPRGELFAFVTSRDADRAVVARITDVAAAIEGEFNTGGAGELDDLAGLVLAEKGRFAVSFGTSSDVAAVVDVEAQVLHGRVPLPSRPLSAAELPGGRVAVGLESGAVMALEAGALTVSPAVTLAGPVRELAATEDPRRLLARVGGGGGDRLELVDVAGGAVLQGVDLPASHAAFSSLVPFGVTSLALDRTRGRAYALSVGASVTLTGLDLATGASQSLVLPGLQVNLPGLLVDDAGGRVYVGTGLEGLACVDVSGASMSLLWSRPASTTALLLGGSPRLHLSEDGAVLFADLSRPSDPANGGAAGPGLSAVDAATGMVLASVPNVYASGFDVARDHALVARGGQFALHRYDRTSRSFDAPESFSLTGTLRFLTQARLDPEEGRAVLLDGGGQPGIVIRDLFAGRVTSACDAGSPNSSGARAVLELMGSPFAGDVLAARISGLEPGGMLGLLVVGDALVPPAPLAGGPGSLCVGGALGRFAGQLQLADAAGEQRYTIDSARLPIGNSGVAASPGSTYVFQGWHRDVVGGAAASNTSTAAALMFR